MINRRQFVSAATGAAALVRIPDLFAAKAGKYDLLIKGGRVIDPSRKLDAIRDVAIADGRIAAIAANISSDAASTNGSLKGAFDINPNRLSTVPASPTRAAIRSKSSSPHRLWRWATNSLKTAFSSKAAESLPSI